MTNPQESGSAPAAADTIRLHSKLRDLVGRIAALVTQVGEVDHALRKLRQEAEEAILQVSELERQALERAIRPAETPAPAAEAAPVEPTAAPVEEANAPGTAPLAAAEPTPEPEPTPSLPPTPGPAQVAEAASDPRKLFGPNGEDGRPCHVLLDLLSRDAMGAIYRACERATSRFFAVRFMAGQAGEEQTAAIEREAEKLIALPHPNILHILGTGRRQNRLYISMDLIDAVPLAQVNLKEIKKVATILRDAAEAVHYAHEEGILHGDLNPENILVAREGTQERGLVKDFGLGFLMENVIPASGRQAGLLIRNPAFLPPEQMKEAKPRLSIAADIYGLGATLYAALAGRPPFEGKDVRQVRGRVLIEEPHPLERARPDMPEALAAIVRRAMAKEVSLRYDVAKEMAEALSRFLEGRNTTMRIRRPAVEGTAKGE